MLDNFKFLESAAADFSDEDEDDDIDGREKSIIDTSTVSWITDINILGAITHTLKIHILQLKPWTFIFP